MILEDAPPANQQQPGVLLEIGGGSSPRPYTPQALQEKHLVTANVDPDEGLCDTLKICADVTTLTRAEIGQRLGGRAVNAIVISHSADYFRESFGAVLGELLPLLARGGSVYLVGKTPDSVDNFLKYRPGEADVASLVQIKLGLRRLYETLEERAVQNGMRVRRYLVGPVLSDAHREVRDAEVIAGIKKGTIPVIYRPVGSPYLPPAARVLGRNSKLDDMCTNIVYQATAGDHPLAALDRKLTAGDTLLQERTEAARAAFRRESEREKERKKKRRK